MGQSITWLGVCVAEHRACGSGFLGCSDVVDEIAGQRVPVLMRTTRYWREPQIGWTVRMLVALHQAGPLEALEDEQAAYFNQRHFAVLAADRRGSGASGGNRVGGVVSR